MTAPTNADFTIATRTEEGNGGYLDLCSTHLETRLAELHFAAQMIAGLIRNSLKG